MTELEAKNKGFTHHGKMYGVPIYLTDDENMNIEGTTWLSDKFLSFLVWFDTTFEINDAFPILKGRKISD